jgi:hypothetical protein
MKRREFVSSLIIGCCGVSIIDKSEADILPDFAIPPPQPHHVIDFEALGGVGDGDLSTGRGTDNASAFARAEAMAQQGYGVKFKSKSCYKTTKQINVHNMYWIGDEISSPIIFSWFSEKGQKIIGRSNQKSQLSVCIIGLTFHRCGPFAEHGIVVDNIDRLYLDIAVTSEPGSQGGAIGISPFFPENRHSRNCFIKARITNSGDYGVQFGSVSGAIVDVTANDCYREVIGIEPIVFGSLLIKFHHASDGKIFLPNLEFSTGDPILYCRGSVSRGPLKPGNHYFIIRNDDSSVSLADSRLSAINGSRLNLEDVDGEHYFARAGVVEHVVIRNASIVDNYAKKPTMYANTKGYIVITGNSGGYVEDINIEKIYIEGNQRYPTGKSFGIYVEGVSDLLLDNIKINGCDDAIVVSDGWLNGMFDEHGKPIHVENGYAKILSKNVSVVSPDLVNFRESGVLFRGSGGSLRGGRFNSIVKYSKALVRE